MSLLCRLLEEGQHARLLSFPDLFSQDLSQWLQSRLAAAASDRTQAATLRRLTWLHELRMKQYGAASRTLADVTNNNEVIARLAQLDRCLLQQGCVPIGYGVERLLCETVYACEVFCMPGCLARYIGMTQWLGCLTDTQFANNMQLPIFLTTCATLSRVVVTKTAQNKLSLLCLYDQQS